jgi:hypothetical protein
MNHELLISAVFDQPGLLENFVEKLAWRRYDLGYTDAIVPKSLRPFESSSTETFVSGTIAIADHNEVINMPFITRYLFTCTKEKGGHYKLEGGFSLS